MADYLSYHDLRENSVKRKLPNKLPDHKLPALLFLLSPSIRTLIFNASAFTRNRIHFKDFTKRLPNERRYLDPPAPKCICSTLPSTSNFIQQHKDSPFFGHIMTMDPMVIPLLKDKVHTPKSTTSEGRLLHHGLQSAYLKWRNCLPHLPIYLRMASNIDHLRS